MFRPARVSLLVFLTATTIGVVLWMLGIFDHRGPKDATVVIFRHGEKPDSGPGLSRRGVARAESYPRFFQTFGPNAQPFHIDAIFASKNTHESHREHLTVELLAKACGLPIDARFGSKEGSDLVAELRKTQNGKHVAICWHHGEIPGLLRALGAKPASFLPEGDWPDQVYDWVIELKFDQDGRVMVEDSRRVKEPLSEVVASSPK